MRLGACLSLTGRYARFGQQAAAGLRAWRAASGLDVELRVDDDASEPGHVAGCMLQLASSCDVVLGPYSSQLMRAAAKVLPEAGFLLWNHGGAADDVQAACPGRVVSVLTPARHYAKPFLGLLAAQGRGGLRGGVRAGNLLRVARGTGIFAGQVAAGAEALARQLGINAEPWDLAQGPLPAVGEDLNWDLLCAGTFEEDVETVARVQTIAKPPRLVCAIAAGVSDFGRALPTAAGVHGVAQWLPEAPIYPEVGPTGPEFVAAYQQVAGSLPDYPAAQAAAAAGLAMRCAEAAGSLAPEALWSVAVGLKAKTFFGEFAIDPETGVQIAHEVVLTLWSERGLIRADQVS
jgi:ABC-type branched-subunit amino acid transport system substrate-binding protein